jgi:hypothetical protein
MFIHMAEAELTGISTNHKSRQPAWLEDDHILRTPEHGD